MRRPFSFIFWWILTFIALTFLATTFSPWFVKGLPPLQNTLLHARQLLLGEGLFLPLLGISFLFALGWTIIASALSD